MSPSSPSACTLAVHASGTRMVFSMAREGTLPFSRRLHQVSSRTGTPIGAVTVTGHTWWLRWSALLFLALILAAGGAIHLRTRVERRGPIVLDPVATSAEHDEAA